MMILVLSDHDDVLDDALYDDGRVLIKESVARLHLDDVVIDECIADECQTGDSNACIAYFYLFACF